MQPPVDTSCFQLGTPPGDDPAEEQPLLDELEAEARAFMESFRWAPPIRDLVLAFAVGPIIGLFLVRFEHGAEGAGEGDAERWVVVGDLPPMYLVTDDNPTPADALDAYCELAEDWADRALAGEDVSSCVPIAAPPTPENGELLASRIANIREMFIPIAGSLDRRTGSAPPQPTNDNAS